MHMTQLSIDSYWMCLRIGINCECEFNQEKMLNFFHWKCPESVNQKKGMKPRFSFSIWQNELIKMWVSILQRSNKLNSLNRLFIWAILSSTIGKIACKMLQLVGTMAGGVCIYWYLLAIASISNKFKSIIYQTNNDSAIETDIFSSSKWR